MRRGTREILCQAVATHASPLATLLLGPALNLDHLEQAALCHRLAAAHPQLMLQIVHTRQKGITQIVLQASTLLAHAACEDVHRLPLAVSD